MSHATSSNSDCRIFFANLTGLCTFFSTSAQRAARLEEFLHKKGLPRSSKIKWNFNSRTVNAVYEHREDIIGALEKIEREATSQTTIQQAGAHLRILEDESFIYWLTFFHKIVPHVDILFNQLQKVTTDALKIHNNIGDFERAIGKIRSEIGNTETQPVDQNNSELTPPSSRRRRTADKSERRRQSIEVCDSILLEIKTRFQCIGHSILSKLVSFNQFPLFEKEFPEDFLEEAIKFYPCLNGGRLRTELSVLYSREEFRQSSDTSAVRLLGLLQDGTKSTIEDRRNNRIVVDFSQAYKIEAKTNAKQPYVNYNLLTDSVELRDTIFDLIKSIKDPEKPNTLEELNVVYEDGIIVKDPTAGNINVVRVEFNPTIPHCSLATLIGLCIRIKLERCLPYPIKLDIFIKAGAHTTEQEINKQINDKERIAAAMENPNLKEMKTDDKCVNDVYIDELIFNVLIINLIKFCSIHLYNKNSSRLFDCLSSSVYALWLPVDSKKSSELLSKLKVINVKNFPVACCSTSEIWKQKRIFRLS
ncbi:unnamed protein product [Callosobruchus maculatus]|uniref:MIP18 family-like domain-containing protein n=1 Tax=Callosobruchus maculatus TaxID=64391 RepID=A0A653DG83_CALMS|nr:unnamed protein product [Callosobruchus maculatus]